MGQCLVSRLLYISSSMTSNYYNFTSNMIIIHRHLHSSTSPCQKYFKFDSFILRLNSEIHSHTTRNRHKLRMPFVKHNFIIACYHDNIRLVQLLLYLLVVDIRGTYGAMVRAWRFADVAACRAVSKPVKCKDGFVHDKSNVPKRLQDCPTHYLQEWCNGL